MQLFITNNFQIQWNKIQIAEKRIFDQLRKVLRARPGYKFVLQNLVYPIQSAVVKRYYLVLESFNNGWVNAIVNDIEEFNLDLHHTGIATAYLNKVDKMELIAQKLTELWIENIIFYPAQRSVVKQLSQNKIARLQKIILEAAEQSWNLFVPQLILLDKFEDLLDLGFKHYFVADSQGQAVKCKINHNYCLCVIGPEWWFQQKEINQLTDKIQLINLWGNTLRAETAAIVAWWLISWR